MTQYLMPEYIYLIRNGDLYNIGCTEDLSQTKKKLAPGKIEASHQSEDAKSILKILQETYALERLPQSNYFRLTKTQYLECKNKLERGYSKNHLKPFFSGVVLIMTFSIMWITLTTLIIKLGIDPIFNQFY